MSGGSSGRQNLLHISSISLGMFKACRSGQLVYRGSSGRTAVKTMFFFVLEGRQGQRQGQGDGQREGERGNIGDDKGR